MKLLKILTSRLFVFGLLILVQALWVFFFASSLLSSYTWLRPILFLMSMSIVLWLVIKDENPSYKISWIILILIFPIFGGLLYFFIGNKKPSQHLERKMKPVISQLSQYMLLENDMSHFIENGKEQGFYYLSQLGYGTYGNTKTRYYSLGDYSFRDLLYDLKHAKHYIFMEYFIVSEGFMFDTILNILRKKVQEGVEVRFIYDDVGSLTTVPYHFEKQLEQWGIQCVVFNPFVPILSMALNHRDHRKICIIDGYIGYSGGFNLADEYINAQMRFGHWKDTGIRLEGEAVWNLTAMFLTIWNGYKHTDKDYTLFYPQVYCPQKYENDGFVVAFGDSPTDNEPTGENIYLNMIQQAKEEILIMTPYFIIDDTMTKALVMARKKGIKVKIITPGIPDKKVIYKVTRSYYHTLIQDGIEIYEYIPGFLHAKVVLCDKQIATVGTINFDYRSFYLHFECNVLLYKTSTIYDINKDFEETIKLCKRIDQEHSRRFKGFYEAILRLFAPLM